MHTAPGFSMVIRQLVVAVIVPYSLFKFLHILNIPCIRTYVA